MKKLIASVVGGGALTAAAWFGPVAEAPVLNAVAPVEVEQASAQPIGGVSRLWAGRCSVATWWNNNGTLSAQVMTPNGNCYKVHLYVVLAGRTVQAILKYNPCCNTVITTTIPITPTGGCYVRVNIQERRSDGSIGIGHAWDFSLFGLGRQKW